MKHLLQLSIVFLFLSCSYLPSPESFNIIQGNYCYIICDGDYSESVYRQVLSLADESFIAIQKMTGIDIQSLIPIYFNDSNFNNDAGIAYENGIYLNYDFFLSDKELKMHVLKHEMVHMFFSLYYGHTTSFLFSEGVAEYFSYDRSDSTKYSSLCRELENWIDFSYIDYGLKRNEYEEIFTDIYSLSHKFIYFWCQTYGEDSLQILYRDISAENIISKLEEYSNSRFNDLNRRFLEFIGESE
ncbi:MAG: hypothetical protein JEY91_07185 [Spirochaetaceae bacterium]|nr:hypothetical protein [Spirochaetaceae bacterium]